MERWCLSRSPSPFPFPFSLPLPPCQDDRTCHPNIDIYDPPKTGMRFQEPCESPVFGLEMSKVDKSAVRSSWNTTEAEAPAKERSEAASEVPEVSYNYTFVRRVRINGSADAKRMQNPSALQPITNAAMKSKRIRHRALPSKTLPRCLRIK